MSAHLKDFISRCKQDFSELAEENYNNWKGKHRANMKEYYSTEKGKEAFQKGWKKRSERVRVAKDMLTKDELEEVKKFYKDCPDGYVVDHKTPLCRGGTYQLDNLQYLTLLENARKGTKTQEEWNEIKHFYKDVTEM